MMSGGWICPKACSLSLWTRQPPRHVLRYVLYRLIKAGGISLIMSLTGRIIITGRLQLLLTLTFHTTPLWYTVTPCT
jgi:hypothetical protein